MADLIQLPFRAGLEEGTDAKQLPSGALKVGKNVRQDKLGRVVKRHGTQYLSDETAAGGDITVGARLFEAGDGGLGLIDGTDAHVFAESLSFWQKVDRVPKLRATKRPLCDSGKSAHAVDVALSGNLLVTVWMTASEVFGAGSASDQEIAVQVHDVTTWAVVMPPTQVVSAGRHPRVVINGTKAVIFWTNSSGQLRYRDLPLTTLVLGTAASLWTGLVASSMFDVHVDGTTFHVAANVSGTGVRIQTLSAAYASAAGPTTVAALSSNLADVCIHATSGESGYVAWAEQGIGGTVELATYNPSTTAVTVGPTTMASPTEVDSVFVRRQSSTTALLGWGHESTDTAGYYAMTTELITGSSHAVTANTVRTTTDVLPISRPWKVGSQWYVAVATMSISAADNSVAASSSVVVEISLDAYTAAVATHPHVATLENQIGAPRELEAATPSWIRGWTVPVDADGFAYCCSMAVHEPWISEDLVPARSVHVSRLDDQGDIWRPLTNGRVTMIVSAAPGIYDGLTVQPYGFARAPHVVNVTGGGGGSVVNGVYLYSVVLVRRNPDGTLQRSIPSNLFSRTASTGSNILRIAGASLSGKVTERTGFAASQSPTFVELYRSTVGSSILYKLTFEPADNIVANSPTAAFVTFEDTRADSSIASGAAVALASRPQLYTNSELDDLPPPAATTGEVHKNRFWLIASDELTLWASKDASEDLTLAPGFNEELTLGFATRKKALASLDEKLVVFGERDIDVIYGNGPTASGEGNDWQIARVQSDVGTTNPRSVAVCPAGVVFLSARGFELLDRGLVVKYIGDRVEDTLASYPVVTSAVVVPVEEEVRWTCNNDDASDGVVIVWNYRINAWYVRTYWNEANEAYGEAVADARLIGGVYTMLLPDGYVIRETTDAATDVRFDGTHYVPMDVQVPVYPSGPAGWHRLKDVQIVGQSLSNHRLTVEIARDFAASFEQSKTWAEGTDVTTIGPLEQARVTLKHQKRQAAVVRITDAAPTDDVTYPIGTGQGPALEMLGLYVGRKTGPAKVSSGRKG